jgi:hypothetical protein
MEIAIRRLRSEAQQLARGKAPRAIRYPARFRTTAVRIARAHVDQGRALADLADEVGVATPTLKHWLERPASLRLRRVVTIEHAVGRGERDRPRPVLTTPQGVRVEGLDAEALIAVLRALA